MPAFHVTATTRIDRPISDVHAVIADFNSWPAWSPWLCMEPEARVDCHGEPATVGHGYSWTGEKVGAGEMDWTHLSSNQLDAKLTFLKPFKSKADIGFTLNAVGDSTDVEWVMDSSLPFFMFFMVNTMKGMITMDYNRGLHMLKDYVETGVVPAEMTAAGVVDTPVIRYAGVTKTSAIDQMGDSMESAFSTVVQGFESANISAVGSPLAVYHEMNIGKGECRYTAALPIEGNVDVSGGTLNVGDTNVGKAYKVVHTGPYRHLGNAWALGMSDMRHLKLKASKHSKPFEVYVNDPAATPENDLITEIYLPIR